MFSTIWQKNLTGYSVKEASVILDILGIKYKMVATGYIKNQSISPGTIINNEMEVVLN